MSSKIILTIGTSTGFGNLTAKLLAKNGHMVYATMRNTKTIQLKTIQHHDNY